MSTIMADMFVEFSVGYRWIMCDLVLTLYLGGVKVYVEW